MFNQVIDEARSSTPLVDAVAERGIELDAAVKKQGGNRPMLEPTSREEGLRHRGGVVVGAGCVEPCAHAVVIVQSRQSVQITRQNFLSRKELQDSLGPRANGVFPDRRI